MNSEAIIFTFINIYVVSLPLVPPPIFSAEETTLNIVSNWCSLPSILQTGFNPDIRKTLGTGPLGVNQRYPKSKCPCKFLPILLRNNNKPLTVNTQWGNFLILFVQNCPGENSWFFLRAISPQGNYPMIGFYLLFRDISEPLLIPWGMMSRFYSIY